MLSSVFPLFETFKKVMAAFKAPESAFLLFDLDLEMNHWHNIFCHSHIRLIYKNPSVLHGCWVLFISPPLLPSPFISIVLAGAFSSSSSSLPFSSWEFLHYVWTLLFTIKSLVLWLNNLLAPRDLLTFLHFLLKHLLHLCSPRIILIIVFISSYLPWSNDQLEKIHLHHNIMLPWGAEQGSKSTSEARMYLS